jgi:hypothetical protein
LKYTNDNYIFIVENHFGHTLDFPPIRLKFPATITWAELSSGNTISNLLLNGPIKEYFVFGDSGLWGKYVANDYGSAVDIIGYKKELAKHFIKHFKLNPEKQFRINNELPDAYKKRILSQFS